jgi:BirA family transcriptional regulator, biotin operon repressor / biotin---[acetyl-CoA-carboxylase] ligase
MIESTYDSGLKQAAEILVLLKKQPDKPLTAHNIASALSITTQRVYDSISYLRSCGFGIEANRREGYKLVSVPDNLSPVEIAAELKSRRFGCRIYSYKSVGSTNVVAQDLAKSGYPEGTLVIADTQTKGKGRLGRKWHSPPGKGLYFSLILRPDIPPDRIAGLSLVAGLAVVRAVKEVTGIGAQTKWPNDVLYKKKKIAGILVELAAELDRINYMVLGCGINVNTQKKHFPLGMQMKSTSLRIINRKDVPRVQLLRSMLKHFEDLYDNFCRHGFGYLSGEIIHNSGVVGKQVTLIIGKQKISGKVVSIDDDGRLVLKNKTGLMSYPAGEVSLR